MFRIPFTRAALALVVSFVSAGCGPLSSFTPMEYEDPETGVQLLYAMPQEPGWRPLGRVDVRDAYSEGDAERRALREARRNGCDAVYIAAIDEIHEVSALTSFAQLLALGGSKTARDEANAAADRERAASKYSARAVCLVRVAQAASPAPAAPVPDAPEAPVPERVVDRETLAPLIGEGVVLTFADGTVLRGELAGDDGAFLFVRREGRTLRVAARHLMRFEHQ
jgi:hypothetical protein